MEPFEIMFEYNNRSCAAKVERRESPAVQYIVYFNDEDLDLKYGQLIYEIKSGQLMNRDDNYLQENRIPVED